MSGYGDGFMGMGMTGLSSGHDDELLAQRLTDARPNVSAAQLQSQSQLQQLQTAMQSYKPPWSLQQLNDAAMARIGSAIQPVSVATLARQIREALSQDADVTRDTDRAQLCELLGELIYKLQAKELDDGVP